MNTSRTKKICITLCILTILGAAGWYGLYFYIRHNAEMASAIASETQARSIQQQKTKMLQNFLNDIASSTETLKQAVIPDRQEGTFISSLEFLARSTGLSIAVESVETVSYSAAPDSYEYLRLGFSTQGSWKNTYAFLALIETLPYRTNISRITFKTLGD
jgi:hypothetical protein